MFDIMSLSQISSSHYLFNDTLSLSDVYFLRYNDQQHVEKTLQSPCTMNIIFSLPLSEDSNGMNE